MGFYTNLATLDNLNRQIEGLQYLINKNEKLQSDYEAVNGHSSEELYAEHEKYCDQMDELCAKRRAIDALS